MNETYELIRHWKCNECNFNEVHIEDGSWKCNQCKSDNLLLNNHEFKLVQPDRLRRVDTYVSLNDYEGNEQQWKRCWLSEAIVGSANIDEIAEEGRNDLLP